MNFKLEYDDIERAKNWYKDHSEHVNNLLKESDLGIAPSGIDRYDPRLWKGIHWRWFLGKYQIQIIKEPPSLNWFQKLLKKGPLGLGYVGAIFGGFLGFAFGCSGFILELSINNPANNYGSLGHYLLAQTGFSLLTALMASVFCFVGFYVVGRIHESISKNKYPVSL